MFPVEIEKSIPKKGLCGIPADFSFSISQKSPSSLQIKPNLLKPRSSPSSSASSSSSNVAPKGGQKSKGSSKKSKASQLESEILQSFFFKSSVSSPLPVLLPSSSSENVNSDVTPLTSSDKISPSSSSSSSSACCCPSHHGNHHDAPAAAEESSQELEHEHEGEREQREAKGKGKEKPVEIEHEHEAPSHEESYPYVEDSDEEEETLEIRDFYDLEVADEEEEIKAQYRLLSAKNDGTRIRASSHHKKPKVNPDRYVNAFDHKREEELRNFLSCFFESYKANRRIILAKELSLLNHERASGKVGGRSHHQFRQASSRSSRRTRSQAHQRAAAFVPPSSDYIDSRELQNMARIYGVTPQIMEQIQKLQWKPNLTPEDYELLLLLDQAVKPKTVATNDVNSLPKKKLSEEDVKKFEGVCPICISPYLVNETIKTLPCGHFFHSHCIEYWLLNASTKCPSDGLPIFPEH